ncbi:MAG: DUF3422 domain-containing protein [Aestuariivita sp.]|nr:DUF3422 domain-containing protein [Aestuariivita sp.]
MPKIQDHPLRYKLANELHARPFPSIEAPCTAVFLAIKKTKDATQHNQQEDYAHLITLLDQYGAPHPEANATHYSGQIGRHHLKWEQHTEFVTYTAFTTGATEKPYDSTEFDIFPQDWLVSTPGNRMTSAFLRIEEITSTEEINQKLSDWFVPESLAASWILDGEGIAAGDFRIDPAGHLRFAIFVKPNTAVRRIGRVVQRLCEIEIYKAMSMLGFSMVKNLSLQINILDVQLTTLTGEMAAGETPAEETLPKLLSISAELEEITARCAFRLGATEAYEAIVTQRIAALREKRLDGRQTFSEFMVRRYEPAMRTVKSTEKRIQSLAHRAQRASSLLRTMVDVKRNAQNQKLLESMNKRADLQLRLQRTVEGLSVVAISYYAVSLLAYLINPLSETIGLTESVLTAIMTFPIVLVVWWFIRQIRKLE